MSENFRFLERLTINLILLLYQLYKTWYYFFFPTTYAFSLYVFSRGSFLSFYAALSGECVGKL